jgi:hypothetical protein
MKNNRLENEDNYECEVLHLLTKSKDGVHNLSGNIDFSSIIGIQLMTGPTGTIFKKTDKTKIK